MSSREPILEPVFVTGIGIVSPAGSNTESSWQAIIANKRCIRSISDPELTGGGALCAGQVPGFVPPRGLECADRVCQLAVAAADQAIASARLPAEIGKSIDPARVGISFGTSKGGILTFDHLARKYKEIIGSISRCDPLYAPRVLKMSKTPDSTIHLHSTHTTSYCFNTLRRSGTLLTPLYDIPPDAPARWLTARYGATGPTHVTVAACSTGTLATIRGMQMIRDGQADVVLAGASDASLHPLWFATFRRMGVLAGPHPTLGEEWACRPFDRDRCGFVIGEGAATLVLESKYSVGRRGVNPLARILGYAMSTDSTGLAVVDTSGAPLAKTIEIACRRAAVPLTRISAIQAHGTGTPTNDLAEINALRFCGLCTSNRPISSLKGAFGHLLGAAGAVELSHSVQAMSRRLFPGNTTHLETDPAMADAWLPKEPVPMVGEVILKTSLGFGGHIGVVLIGAA